MRANASNIVSDKGDTASDGRGDFLWKMTDAGSHDDKMGCVQIERNRFSEEGVPPHQSKRECSCNLVMDVRRRQIASDDNFKQVQGRGQLERDGDHP